MKETKFRAWDIENKEFIDHFYIEPNGDIRTTKYSSILKEHFTLLNHRVVLIQYTGLKDKNGKEIYEGYLIRWVNSNEVEEVEWEPFYGGNFNGPGWRPFIGQEFPADCEIIGNIYENPELLK